MATGVSQKQLRSTSKRRAPLTVKVRAARDPRKGLRPRTALRDIGNRVTKPKVQTGAKKSAVEACHRLWSTVGPTTASTRGYMVTKGALLAPQKDMPESEPQTEPSQPEPQSSTSMEVSACAPAENELCQASSGIISEFEDLDVEDGDDPSLCSSYVNDIYNYLRELEEKQPIKCHYLSRQEIDGNMRATVVDWLVTVHMRFSLQDETLFMTVAIIDHFLQDNPVSKTKLQLVGITALFMASKYEEMGFLPLIDHSYVTEYSCSKFQIHEMEKTILKALGFFLGFPLPTHFLRQASKIAKMDYKQHILAKYLMELCIVDYDMVHFPPSRIAAAAFCLSLKLLNGCKLLPFLEHYTSYTESDLLPVMQHIAKNLVLLDKDIMKEKAVMKKYAMSTNIKISTIKQLQSSIIQDLAEPLVKKL